MDIKSEHIFKYPAVEYIPLYFTTIQKYYNWYFPLKETRIFVCEHPDIFIEQLNSYKVYLSANKLKDDDCLFIAIFNFEINQIAYRGNKVTLLGQNQKKSYHLTTIPKKYFYKTSLHFEVYNQMGKKVSWCNFILQHKRESFG